MTDKKCPDGFHVWEFFESNVGDRVVHGQRCRCGKAMWPNPTLYRAEAPSPTVIPRMRESECL